AHVRQLDPPPDIRLVETLRAKVDQYARIDINQALKIAGITSQVAGLVRHPLAPALSAEAQAQAWCVKGDYEKALKKFDEAEGIYRDQQMEIETARIARSKIAVLMYMDRYAEALAIAERARAIFDRHGERVPLAKLDTNIGNIYHRLDQHAKALEYYDRA